MDIERIRDKLRKLQALASHNPSLEEAARAAEMIQKLKDRYDLADACLAVERDEPEEFNDITNEMLRAGRRVPTWEAVLINVLASVNGCKAYLSGGVRVVGCPEDVETIRWFHSYLAGEINQLCVQVRSDLGATGRTWGNSFRLGAVDTLCKRLREAKREGRQEARESVAGNVHALAVVDKGLARIDAKMTAVAAHVARTLQLSKGTRRSARRDADAFGWGQWAAKGIGLGRHAIEG
ncbi:MAG TPA: DUF2786 domain-containing protein [Anaerolineae bacterium]|nr:DUF2786 domain-containing protein [Anaerolineae bacterium]